MNSTKTLLILILFALITQVIIGQEPESEDSQKPQDTLTTQGSNETMTRWQMISKKHLY